MRLRGDIIAVTGFCQGRKLMQFCVEKRVEGEEKEGMMGKGERRVDDDNKLLCRLPPERRRRGEGTAAKNWDTQRRRRTHFLKVGRFFSCIFAVAHLNHDLWTFAIIVAFLARVRSLVVQRSSDPWRLLLHRGVALGRRCVALSHVGAEVGVALGGRRHRRRLLLDELAVEVVVSAAAGAGCQLLVVMVEVVVRWGWPVLLLEARLPSAVLHGSGALRHLVLLLLLLYCAGQGLLQDGGSAV